MKRCQYWQPGCQRTFWAVGHHHIGEGGTIDNFFTEIEEGQNMRMVKNRNNFSLSQEETASISERISIRIEGNFRANNLNRYLSVNTCIFCKIDIAHATTTNSL